MKKLIYILILATMSSLAITSCTEEVVQPSDNPATGGKGTGDGIG